MGDAGWDLPPRALTGSPEAIAESLHELVGLGVNNLMLGLVARSCAELEEQMEAFATGVGPLL